MSTVEDYPNGYPHFGALIASHNTFHIFRRFSYLRTRLLLLKQDRLSQLEEQLEKVDLEEKAPRYRGCSRRDKNEERGRVLGDIDAAISNYDEFVQRSHRMMNLNAARKRGIASLRNWIEGKGCIARKESKFLECESDLMNISTSPDDALERLEGLAEEGLMRCFKSFRAKSNFNVSRDPNVYVYNGSTLRRAARIMVILTIDALLFIPVIVINEIDRSGYRIVVIAASCALFILVLSGFTKARTSEIFIAAATYAAILVVFIAGSQG